MDGKFKAFFKKAVIQGEKVEMVFTAMRDGKGVFDATRMTDKTLIVTLEDIQQELPLDAPQPEPEGMDELPIEQPTYNVTVNNYHVDADTGEVREEADEAHQLPYAEVELADEGAYGNTEEVYGDEPIPQRDSMAEIEAELDEFEAKLDGGEE